MREERGSLPGNLVISEALDLWGSVGGDVSIIEGGKLYMRGGVYGNMTVENGGRVHIYGTVQGNLIVHKGAKVIHSGILGGDAVNLGGRLYIEQGSRVDGKVKPKQGETHVNGREVGDPKPRR